jgi:hypothetical protein
MVLLMKIEPIRTNYIFIDFENVPEVDLDRIAGKPVKVVLVLGEQHKRLPVLLVKKLHQYASQVQLVETGSSGKNALDLILASYLGESKKSDPHGYFHIISKDKDFDALITHLKTNRTLAARHQSFGEIPVLMNKTERIKYIVANFKSKPGTRAKKRTTLASQIQAMFGKALSEAELNETINGLIAQKAVTIGAAGEVEYKL